MMSGSRQRRFRYVAVGLLSTGLVSVGSALAWADESITLDFVRHGETAANAQGIIDTHPPGDPLDSTGVTQAQYLASPDNPQALDAPSSYAGIYVSDEYRTLQTAQDWLTAAHAPLTDVTGSLSGLNEIPAGIFNGDPTLSLQGILYILSPIAWTLGLELVPEFGDPSVNGITFDESFGGAVQTIYDNTVALSSNPTDAAFSSEGAIAVWTLMNVNNPDFGVVLKEFLQTGQFLPNTGQVVVEGSPGDWTLVSYNGTPVPQNPGLPTELFVDFRNLIEAPQFAGYNILEALGNGPAAILSALDTGAIDVGKAVIQFPISVFDDIVNALTGGMTSLGTDVSAAAADAASVVPGELGSLAGDFLAAL